MKSLSLTSGQQGVRQQLRRLVILSHLLLHLLPIQIMCSVLIVVDDSMNMQQRDTYHFVKNRRVASQIHRQQKHRQQVRPSENR